MHSLQKQFPFLFTAPSRSAVRVAVLISLALALSSIFWMAVAPRYGRGVFYLIPTALLTIHGYVTYTLAQNILFFSRYLFISVIGLAAAIAWSFQDNILIAPFGETYQTHEATVALIGSVMLAVAGTTIGWFSAFGSAVDPASNNNLEKPSGLRFARWAALSTAVTVVVLNVYKAGGFISSSKHYAQDQVSLPFEFGAFNAVFFVCTSVFFLASHVLGFRPIYTLSILILLYLAPILTGSRADYLPQIAIILFVSIYMNCPKQSATPSIPRFLPAVGILGLYIAGLFIGQWRHVGDFRSALADFIGYWSPIQERSAGLVLSLSTGNQVAGHFYAVYGKTHYLGEPFLVGSSYFDFLWRTPPAFLGLPRPTDLAWEMSVLDEQMAQGGIFEVAEAYWNFGYLGAFFVPMLLTFLMSNLLKIALRSAHHGFFLSASYFTIMLMFPRGIWYQTFAYWRTATVILVLYILTRVAAIFFEKDTRSPKAQIGA